MNGTPSAALQAAMDRSRELVQEVQDTYKVSLVTGLFSGGNDSSTFMHLVKSWDIVDEVCHVDTGIGIPDTQEYVRAVCAHYDLPLFVQSSPREEDSYDALCVRFGFPGPGGHGVMYRRLKERALRAYRADAVRRHDLRSRAKKGQDPDRIVFLGGMRWDESARRTMNANEVDEEGIVVWVSPIVHWTDELMAEYRRLFQCNEAHQHVTHRLCSPTAIGRNWVSDTIHMSGECLCGAFAKEGEIEEIEMWFPEVAERIHALEAVVEAHGHPACVWGKRPPRVTGATAASNASQTAEVLEAQARLGEAKAMLCTRCVVEPTWDDVTAMVGGSTTSSPSA